MNKILTHEVEIDVVVYCADCDEELGIVSIDATEPYHIKVSPCESCRGADTEKEIGA